MRRVIESRCVSELPEGGAAETFFKDRPKEPSGNVTVMCCEGVSRAEASPLFDEDGKVDIFKENRIVQKYLREPSTLCFLIYSIFNIVQPYIFKVKSGRSIPTLLVSSLQPLLRKSASLGAALQLYIVSFTAIEIY